MLDLHNHLLPGVDDGAHDVAVSLDMARAYVDQGVRCVACTPHIIEGLYHNTGPEIRNAVCDLQARIDDAGIDLLLVPGAENHVVQDFVKRLRDDRLVPLGTSKFVLVEPPEHIAPIYLEQLFFDVLVAGFVPILVHPERLRWIEKKYHVVQRLAARGVWLQVTSGSLHGRFGSRAQYWAERMLEEGLVHILASDAHNMKKRPPDLWKGHAAAEALVGVQEAHDLVVTRPAGILMNKMPNEMPAPQGAPLVYELRGNNDLSEMHSATAGGSIGQRLRRVFGN